MFSYIFFYSIAVACFVMYVEYFVHISSYNCKAVIAHFTPSYCVILQTFEISGRISRKQNERDALAHCG
jgi:hypothetical protein